MNQAIIEELENLQNSENWGAIIPLPEEEVKAPQMDVELCHKMIPTAYANWILDIADRMQIPIEMGASAAIGATAGVIGRRLSIKPKRKDDWIIPGVLWSALVARPGEKKTPTLQEILSPLNAIERQENIKNQTEVAKYEATILMKNAKLEAKKDELRVKLKSNNRGDNPFLLGELESLTQEKHNCALKRVRLKTNDPTIEKLGEILKENPNGILVFRDELSGFLKTFQKKGHETDKEFFLEGWNGLGTFTFDRIGRGTLFLDAVCISVFGGIQPTKLDNHIRQILTSDQADDGLIQRFQNLVYPEKLDQYLFRDSFPNREARKCADAIFNRIFDLKNHTTNLPISERHGIPFIGFENEAQELFDEWFSSLERRLHTSKDLPSVFESHIAKYRSLMPTLAMIFHLINWATPGSSQPLGAVTISEAKMAAAWCEFLEGHARKVYSVAFYKPLNAAKLLSTKILKGEILHGSPIRDLYRNHWSGLDNASKVYDAAKVLEKHNWVRTQVVQAQGAPKYVLLLHPSLRSPK